MNDPWARSSVDGGPVFEIPLEGDDVFAPRQPDAPRSARSSRRAIAVVAALGLAGGITAVALANGDEPVATTSTTLDVASQFTTPPTLSPIDTLPPAIPFDDLVVVDLPALTVPTFPRIDGLTDDELAAYDLAAAVAVNESRDVATRTVLTVTAAAASPTGEERTTITISGDPIAQRDSLVLRSDDFANEAIIDRAANTIYSTTGTGVGADAEGWRAIPAEDAMGDSGATNLGELLDTMLTGPISYNALANAAVTPSDHIVRLVGGAFARPFEVVVPVVALRPYGQLLFTGITEKTVEAGFVPDTLTFTVYVTDQPALALVTSRFTVASSEQVFTQLFDRRPANVRIELPPADLIDTPPTTDP